MTLDDIKKLAIKYAEKEQCNIVRYSGYEDGWYYFSFTRNDRPKYSSLSFALRINSNGKIENIDDIGVRMSVRLNAIELLNTQN